MLGRETPVEILSVQPWTAHALVAKAYRDRSGIGRNLTIQVLESFDQTGFTRRMGDARRVVAPVERAVGGG